MWVTADRAAVAMWEPPAALRVAPAHADEVWSDFRARAGETVWGRLTEYERAVDVARPATPHWYLGVLAPTPTATARVWPRP